MAVADPSLYPEHWGLSLTLHLVAEGAITSRPPFAAQLSSLFPASNQCLFGDVWTNSSLGSVISIHIYRKTNPQLLDLTFGRRVLLL